MAAMLYRTQSRSYWRLDADTGVAALNAPRERGEEGVTKAGYQEKERETSRGSFVTRKESCA